MSEQYKFAFYILCCLNLTVQVVCDRPGHPNGRTLGPPDGPEEPQGPNGPEPQGPNGPEPQGPNGPEPQGPSGPNNGAKSLGPGGPNRPQGPFGPNPGGQNKGEPSASTTYDPNENADDQNKASTYQINDVLNMDIGKYSTQNFHYEVNQMMGNINYGKAEVCYDDYIKCLVSQVSPMPVCMFYSTGKYKIANSYCEAYFENCRISYRFWRIVGYGKCISYLFGSAELWDYYGFEKE